jgi:hypothetical protein
VYVRLESLTVRANWQAPRDRTFGRHRNGGGSFLTCDGVGLASSRWAEDGMRPIGKVPLILDGVTVAAPDAAEILP